MMTLNRPAIGRIVLQKSFCTDDQKFYGGFRVKILGASSPHVKPTGDFGNAIGGLRIAAKNKPRKEKWSPRPPETWQIALRSLRIFLALLSEKRTAVPRLVNARSISSAY